MIIGVLLGTLIGVQLYTCYLIYQVGFQCRLINMNTIGSNLKRVYGWKGVP